MLLVVALLCLLTLGLQLYTLRRIYFVDYQGACIMATVQELSDELDQIKTAVDAVKATVTQQIQQIADLTAQISAGTPVSQAQLDDLDAKADSILATLST